MRNHTSAFAILFICFFAAVKSAAFVLQPMVANFTPDGEGATKIFRVENETKETIAVKIQAFTRQIDDKGKETQTPSKDFKIYPDQISLSGSDSRAIRVMYIGPKGLEQESSYRIVATQLPVAFKDEAKKTGIKFLFQFVASVYVGSEKFYPKVEVESVTRMDNENLKIKIVNKGQKHTLLKYVKVELKDATGKILLLNNENIKNWDNENLLSGTRRTFKVKSPLTIDIEKVRPKVEVKDEI